MTAAPHDRFDAATENAWASCLANLTAHLEEMPEGDYVTITAAQSSVGQHGQRPYVDLVGLPGGTMTGIAAVPSYLYPAAASSSAGDTRLGVLGWTEPGKPIADGRIMDRTKTWTRDDAALIAASAIDVFRLVWGVPDPSFLSAWGVGANGRRSGPVDLGRGGDGSPIQPADVDELRMLVTRTLTTRTNLPTTVLAGGDISIGSFASEMFVCFGADTRSVTLHAPVLTGIVDRTQVVERMAWLNTLWTHVRFVFAGGQLFARLDISTSTFVPRQLVLMVNHLAGLLVRVDSEFATRLGGVRHGTEHVHPTVPRTPDRADLPSSLQTLQTMVELTGTPADPATVAAICDRSDIARLLELAHTQRHRAEVYAHILGDQRRITAAVAWDVQAKTWINAATSLEQALVPARTYQRRSRGSQIALFDNPASPALF